MKRVVKIQPPYAFDDYTRVLRLAKAVNPFDEHAEHERETGKSMELRAYAKKHKILLKK